MKVYRSLLNDFPKQVKEELTSLELNKNNVVSISSACFNGEAFLDEEDFAHFEGELSFVAKIKDALDNHVFEYKFDSEVEFILLSSAAEDSSQEVDQFIFKDNCIDLGEVLLTLVLSKISPYLSENGGEIKEYFL
ncbi:MAG: hypothetical protein SPL02_00110 [Bacilli bacterium]|nr:hypothetical protein [Bacilli bacterium]MDY6430572.1 hypothetical protein [Bacilli bacterium]